MILVTGAAGKTGLAVLRALAARGAGTRALIHKAGYEAAVRAAGATDVMLGDLAAPADMATALSGVEALYLIIPNMHPSEAELGQRIVAALPPHRRLAPSLAQIARGGSSDRQWVAIRDPGAGGL